MPPDAMPASAAPAPDESILATLRSAGLIAPDETPRFVPLTGGVASDIWRVEAEGGAFCVKRALAKLRVAEAWHVPVARNANEAGWIEVANAIQPGAAPALLAHVPKAGLFAMDYLDPETHPVWKERLRAGDADTEVARAVGLRLARIHGATAGDPEIAARFASDAIFHAIRLEPYLQATARRHPPLAEALMTLSRETLATKRTLVHGDVSPKNILVGPEGPVFLDAECAWYGDPAFDLSFCLNHLLLKCLWTPAARDGFAACYRALVEAYLRDASWEPVDALERRAARLLPGLLLARVDGKSPVEYVTEEADKDRVRRVAGALLETPSETLAAVWAAWEDGLEP